MQEVQGVGANANPVVVDVPCRFVSSPSKGSSVQWDDAGTDVINGVDGKVQNDATDYGLWAGILLDDAVAGETKMIRQKGFCDALAYGTVNVGDELVPVNGQWYLIAGTFTKRTGAIRAMEAHVGTTASLIKVFLTGR